MIFPEIKYLNEQTLKGTAVALYIIATKMVIVVMIIAKHTRTQVTHLDCSVSTEFSHAWCLQ